MDKPTQNSHNIDAPVTLTSSLRRACYFVLAIVCLGLGILGVFIPGLPTTVFILLAACFAARSSPRLLAWLENHKMFGPMIQDWREGGTVSRKAKWSATIMMMICAAILFYIRPGVWVAEISTGIMVIVATWLWKRPEPHKEKA